MEQVNVPLEIFRTIAVFGAFWGGFYRLVRPEARWRRVILLILMMAFRPVWFFAGVVLQETLSGGLGLVWVLACSGIFIVLCDKPGRVAVTLVYYVGIPLYVDVLFRCAMILYSKGLADYNPPLWFVNIIIEALFILGWTEYFYRVMWKYPAALPLRFWLVILLPLYTGWMLFNIFIERDAPLSEIGGETIWFGLSFGVLLLALNLMVFYLYVKLSVSYEARVFAGELANTPPVWTAEQGLSEAFVQKYELSSRERETAGTMLRGRNDKEIAQELNISVNTVQAHLKSIYRKTVAAGRFAPFALVRG
ncbi:MAG: helix-turn-helix transcriptional regulator [Treponema sp.]|jgi:DNA-binding CsgD family transcriptional regulator|nr:helix-turn-helix transcriptional regulator [Treponema sp.]